MKWQQRHRKLKLRGIPVILLLTLCFGGLALRSSNTDETQDGERQPAETADSSLSNCIITAVVGGGVIGICIVVYVLWEKSRNKKKVAQLQEEHEDREYVITTSAELKKGLQDQKDMIRQQIEEVAEELKSVEKKLGEVEEATDKTEEYVREKQKLLDNKWKLEKRKEELEKLRLNIEKLIQSSEGLISRMTKHTRGKSSIDISSVPEFTETSPLTPALDTVAQLSSYMHLPLAN